MGSRGGLNLLTATTKPLAARIPLGPGIGAARVRAIAHEVKRLHLLEYQPALTATPGGATWKFRRVKNIVSTGCTGFKVSFLKAVTKCWYK